MGTVCIAIGNSLRGDDGAGQYAAELLAGAGAAVRYVQQLTPEIAVEIEGAETVVFLDADVSAAEARLEPVAEGVTRGTPLAHGMTPAEVVCLARRLYGFAGAAWVCHLPAAEFDGEGLSERAAAGARAAAELVAGLFQAASVGERLR